MVRIATVPVCIEGQFCGRRCTAARPSAAANGHDDGKRQATIPEPASIYVAGARNRHITNEHVLPRWTGGLVAVAADVVRTMLISGPSSSSCLLAHVSSQPISGCRRDPAACFATKLAWQRAAKFAVCIISRPTSAIMTGRLVTKRCSWGSYLPKHPKFKGLIFLQPKLGNLLEH